MTWPTTAPATIHAACSAVKLNIVYFTELPAQCAETPPKCLKVWPYNISVASSENKHFNAGLFQENVGLQET